MKWQPINTAPKDGTRILVYNGDGMHVAAWEESTMTLKEKKNWVYASYSLGGWNYYEVVDGVTHWMSLPDPPK